MQNDEKLLCNQIIRDNESLQEPWIKRFEFKSFYVDLNNDGNKEVIVWNNTICGSSGCEIYLYTKNQQGFKKLWGEDIGWAPIIILNSRKTGWRDIAFQIAGGGVNPHFQILQFSKGVYKFKDRQKEQPTGQIILDKNWNQSFYGLIQNQ